VYVCLCVSVRESESVRVCVCVCVCVCMSVCNRHPLQMHSLDQEHPNLVQRERETPFDSNTAT